MGAGSQVSRILGEQAPRVVSDHMRGKSPEKTSHCPSVLLLSVYEGRTEVLRTLASIWGLPGCTEPLEQAVGKISSEDHPLLVLSFTHPPLLHHSPGIGSPPPLPSTHA